MVLQWYILYRYYIVPIALFSVVFNMPKFFELTVEKVLDDDQDGKLKLQLKPPPPYGHIQGAAGQANSTLYPPVHLTELPQHLLSSRPYSDTAVLQPRYGQENSSVTAGGNYSHGGNFTEEPHYELPYVILPTSLRQEPSRGKYLPDLVESL